MGTGLSCKYLKKVGIVLFCLVELCKAILHREAKKVLLFCGRVRSALPHFDAQKWGQFPIRRHPVTTIPSAPSSKQHQNFSSGYVPAGAFFVFCGTSFAHLSNRSGGHFGLYFKAFGDAVQPCGIFLDIVKFGDLRGAVPQ